MDLSPPTAAARQVSRYGASLTPRAAAHCSTITGPLSKRMRFAPHVRVAWMDRDKRKDRIGYEISFNRHFYRYTSPRPLEETDADLKEAERESARLLPEVTA